MKYLLLLFILFGCTRASDPHTFKTIGFTAEEKQAIQLAIDEWTGYGYFSFLDDNCDECSEIHKVTKIEIPFEIEGIKLRSEGCGSTLGCTYAIVDNGLGIRAEGDVYSEDAVAYKIQIIDASSPEMLTKNKRNKTDWFDLLRFVALHEIGHTFRKHHLSDVNTVMYQNVGYATHLTEADLEDN